MQVRRLEPVAIDDADAADAGAGEVLQHRHTETAGADHEHRGGAQPRLALRADFTQRDLARVVGSALAGCGDACTCPCA